MDKNSIFKLGLGLEEPRYIKDSGLVDGILNIKIDFKEGSKFYDEDTKEYYGAYRTNTRKLKHLFMRQYETILEVRIPEIKTSNGHIRVIQFPLADKGSQFTYLFEGMVLELCNNMPVNKVSIMLKEHFNTIMRITNKYVSISRSKADYSNIQNGCIDETSTKKGHNYITSFINLDSKKISSITIGKGAETLSSIIEDIEKHKGSRNNIKTVCIDFSPSFISGCNEYIPNAEIVFDKFHFMQFIYKALDEVRKVESRNNRVLLSKTKYMRLSDSSKLKEDKKKRLEYIMSQNESLSKAYKLKEDIKEFFNKQTVEEAGNYLQTRCDEVYTTHLRPFHKVVKTIKRHRNGILSYIKHHISNGLMEGINGIIQSIKNRGRGYRNIDNFITMIYLKLGDFNLVLPT